MYVNPFHCDSVEFRASPYAYFFLEKCHAYDKCTLGARILQEKKAVWGDGMRTLCPMCLTIQRYGDIPPGWQMPPPPG